MADPEGLAAALQRWAGTRDNRVKAAVGLLVWHEFWLRRADFRAAAVRVIDGSTVIRWSYARTFAEAGPRCSSSEGNVLNLAVAIGLNDFGLDGLGIQHRQAIARAFATAMSLDDDGREPPFGHVAVYVEDFKPSAVTGLISLEEARAHAAERDEPFRRWVAAEVREVPRG